MRITTVAKVDKVRKIALHILENPKMTRQELADSFGIPYQTMCEYIRDNQVLQSVKGLSSKKLLGMLPLAVQGFEDCLTGKNEKIKYFASKDLLQSEKILGPERIDITVSDNSNRTIEELQEKIKKAQMIPSPTIEAEVIT